MGNGTPGGQHGQGGPDSALALLCTALEELWELRQHRASGSRKDVTRGRARTDVTYSTLGDLLDMGSCSICAHLSAAF